MNDSATGVNSNNLVNKKHDTAREHFTSGVDNPPLNESIEEKYNSLAHTSGEKGPISNGPNTESKTNEAAP